VRSQAYLSIRQIFLLELEVKVPTLSPKRDKDGAPGRVNLLREPHTGELGRMPGLRQQRLAGGHDRELVQLGGDVAAVGIGFSGGQTLAELNNLFFASTTPANLGPAAGCGHAVLLDS